MKKITKINLSRLGSSELDDRELNLVKGGASLCACAAACPDACHCFEGQSDVSSYSVESIAASNFLANHDYDNDDSAADEVLKYTSH